MGFLIKFMNTKIEKMRQHFPPSHIPTVDIKTKSKSKTNKTSYTQLQVLIHVCAIYSFTLLKKPNSMPCSGIKTKF